MNIAIYVYEDAEVLDFSGPFEVFTTASRICETSEPFNVFLIAEKQEPVTARSGYKVIPDYGFDNHPAIDVLVIAGGVYIHEMEKMSVLEWIFTQARLSTVAASVCTGVFLLAKSGVLSKQNVTTHWEDIHDLKRMFPDLKVLEGFRWVDEGSVITSGGISAGIDMSLHLVSKLADENLARKTAKQMEFSWTSNRDATCPSDADSHK